MPIEEEVFLDHVGHFVDEPEAASKALSSAGFHPTPISVQKNEGPDGVSRLTGTGNVTAMLRHGYIEVLYKTADTPLGREFDEAISNHPGVHLAAFAVADAKAESERLKTSGFKTRPIVELRRPVETPSGEGQAAFTVARVEHGEMAEGRMQFLTHHSEREVWQERWLNHANGADALLDIVIAVEDIREAGKRFGRFLGRGPMSNAMGEAVFLDRGGVQLMARELFEEIAGPVPALPFIGLYAIRVKSLAVVEKLVARSKIAAKSRKKTLIARFPEALGIGAWLFVEDENDLPWRRS